MTTEREILEDLKRRKRTIEIDGATHWIVEGDLVLNEYRLMQYARAQAESGDGPPGVVRDGLVADVLDDKIIRWAPGKVLSYTVRRDTFASDADYQRAVDAVSDASAAWQDICGVAFEHLSELDHQAEVDLLATVFRVRRVPGGGSTIASAFFPSWSAEERWVNLYDGFYRANLSFDTVGVLRHELGHVLGFRHEHIRGEAPMDCPDESGADTRALTEYDPRSVMHYFCGGMGDAKLAITEVDIAGARSVYGPPLADFELIE